MKILLGITGSVAANLTPKLYRKLVDCGHEVRIIFTETAKYFVEANFTVAVPGNDHNVWWVDDAAEFPNKNRYGGFGGYFKQAPIPHISLREWGDILLICPGTANTIAKMANGICDNLLTSNFRAWDFDKPVFIVPACNTKMWLHPVTKTHLEILKSWNVKIIYPTVKTLACGEHGVGACPDLDTIVNIVNGHRWVNPFGKHFEIPYLPLSPHPGAFGTQRHFCCHTGCDLYADVGTLVNPVEDGEIVLMGQFTGKEVGCEWWNDTWHVTVKGKSGIICYGEIELNGDLKIGQKVTTHTLLGKVLRVVKELPKKIIEGHKPSMLHLELLRGTNECPEWKIGDEKPKAILDPTQYLYLL